MFPLSLAHNLIWLFSVASLLAWTIRTVTWENDTWGLLPYRAARGSPEGMLFWWSGHGGSLCWSVYAVSLQICPQLTVNIPCMEHYYFHYRYYTIPIVIQTWQGQQASIFRELKEMGGGLILSGDCRLVSMLIIVSARPIGMAIDMFLSAYL